VHDDAVVDVPRRDVDDARMFSRLLRAASALALIHCGGPQTVSAPLAPAPDAEAPAPASSSAAPSPEIALDEKSADKTIEVRAGQQIVLTLVTNPTTGYDWTVISAPPALGEATTAIAPPESDLAGAPTKRTFIWTLEGPLGPGEHLLELGYRRSFEKGVAPIKSFRVTLKAAAGA